MSEPNRPISRFTRRLLRVFIQGFVLTIAVELLEAFGVISDLTESVTRLCVWMLLVGRFALFTRRTFDRGDVLLAVILFAVFSSSAFVLMMTEDIPSLNDSMLIGRHGAYHSLTKKIVFSCWSCSIVWIFIVVLRGVEETEASLHENLNRVRQEMDERKRAEAKSLQVQAELAHVNRLATLSEMVTGIAHELNQPLGAISFMSDAGLKTDKDDAPPPPEKTQELMTAIGEQARRAGDIIRRLRDMARRSDENRNEIGINDLVGEVIELVTPELRLNAIDLNLDWAESNPRIYVDRIQIQQVVLNLIRNAADALEAEPKKLSIRTVESPDPAPARKDVPGSAIVVVSDSGVGIAEEKLSNVFKPFFTTKSHGMGMGLSISRSIVEAHDGWLSVLSAVGQGSEFTLTLPLAGQEARE